jgi:transcriptional regulator
MSEKERLEVLQGTLDLLILRTLQWGAQHGHGIGQSIRSKSDELLKVEHGSLYPALQRLQREGWIESEWGITSNNQRAKFYRLTSAGKSQLAVEESKWKLFVKAMSRAMRPQE